MDIGRYKLRILPLFEEDLNEIVDYFSLQRTSCAEAFEPYRSAKERKYPYYRIYVRNYVIFYVVIDDVMEVRRILYNRRDLQSLI